MPKNAGPKCPGCGYPIFGLRDMRCPECGRVLDVRDFGVDGGNRGDAQRYEWYSAIGGVAGIVIVAMLLAAVLLLIGYFASYGRIPMLLVILAGFLGVTLLGLLTHTGQSLASWIKGRK